MGEIAADLDVLRDVCLPRRFADPHVRASLERDQALITHDQHGAALNRLAEQGDDRGPRFVEADVVDIDPRSELRVEGEHALDHGGFRAEEGPVAVTGVREVGGEEEQLVSFGHCEDSILSRIDFQGHRMQPWS